MGSRPIVAQTIPWPRLGRGRGLWPEARSSESAVPRSHPCRTGTLALLSENIREGCTNGANLEARGNILLGSMLAGMAAAVHALAYPIGAIFHVPHGLSN